MAKSPGAEGCLPLTSGCPPPRRIPRPERYEVDDTPLSPPSSSYLLFDSSSVFNSHPHKYRLLINKPTNHGSQESPAVSSQSDHKLLKHRRSKSLVSLPRLEEDSSTNTVVSAVSHDAINDATVQVKHPAVAADDQLLRPRQLPLRKISDSAIHNFRTNSTAPSVLYSQGNYSRDKPEEGEDKVLRNFNDAISLQEDKPVSFQIQPFEHLDERMSSASDLSSSSSSRGSKLSSSAHKSSAPKYVVKEVQPEPRRLFGFGPLYRPLPETVLEKQGETITEKVKKTGLSAIGSDSTDARSAQRKTSTEANINPGEISKTAKRETSVWMPFSF